MADIPEKARTFEIPFEGADTVSEASKDPIPEEALQAAAKVSDGTMPCPVTSPSGLPCTKSIHEGWTAAEGHGGGHFWVGPDLEAIFDGGHYDAAAALSGKPFDGHLPADCRPGCPHLALLAALPERTGDVREPS